MVRKAKYKGLKIMIGGDINAHIQKLDKCDNRNGKLVKNKVNEMKLHIMNGVWERMNGLAWFSENSEFTLDYICVDDCALKSVRSAYILESDEVVESDHASIGADVEWKVKRKRKARRKIRTTRKDGWLLTNGMCMGAKWNKESIQICLHQVGVELIEEIVRTDVDG